MQQRNIDKQDQEIQALLKDYPMPEASADFYDRALVRATHEGTRRQRNRWVLTGFGSAVAAGLAFWMLGGIFLTPVEAPNVDPGMPAITMTLEEPRTINLVFASSEALGHGDVDGDVAAGRRDTGFSWTARGYLANESRCRQEPAAAEVNRNLAGGR